MSIISLLVSVGGGTADRMVGRTLFNDDGSMFK